MRLTCLLIHHFQTLKVSSGMALESAPQTVGNKDAWGGSHDVARQYTPPTRKEGSQARGVPLRPRMQSDSGERQRVKK